MGLLYEKTVTFDSKSGKLAHSGYLSRASAIDDSNKVFEYLNKRCKELKRKLSYDLSYNGFPQDLIVTESFGGHGCLIVHPADDNFTMQLLRECGTGERDFQFLREKKDKYSLFDSEHPATKVVILPGTNLLCLMSKNVIKGMNKPGVYFKPHPITTEFYIREIEMSVGKDKVINKLASGAKIVDNADEVWVSQSTELGLYAKLDGKLVHTYKINYRNKGSYFGLYDQIERLGEVLSTAKSGVIFPTDDYEQQVDEFLEYYEESIKGYTPKTPGNSKKRKKKKGRK
jgi:hypothetical protein